MKHEIEIEGLPEGWRAVAFRAPKDGENTIDFSGDLRTVTGHYQQPRLIVERIKPRRVVLEETNEVRLPKYGEYFREGLVDSKVELCTSHNYECAVRIWTVVEEVE